MLASSSRMASSRSQAALEAALHGVVEDLPHGRRAVGQEIFVAQGQHFWGVQPAQVRQEALADIRVKNGVGDVCSLGGTPRMLALRRSSKVCRLLV